MASQMTATSMYVDDELLLKRLEYLVVCLGLAYTFTTKISATRPAALITGVCTLVVCCLYFLEVRLVTRSKQALIRSHVRSASNLGLWCAVLLPLCLFLCCHIDHGLTCSEPNITVSLASIALIFPSILRVCFAVLKPTNRLIEFVVCCVVLISTGLIFYWFNGADLYSCLFLILFLIIVFELVLHRVLLYAPRSFTLGEAIIVAQGFVLFAMSLVLNVYHKSSCDIISQDNNNRVDYSRNHFVDSNDDLEYREVGEFVNTSLVGCTTLIITLFVHKWFRSPRGFYSAAAFIGLLFIVPVLYFSLGQSPATWLLNFFTATRTRITILCLWGTTAVSSVVFAIIQPSSVNTAVRKYFHIAVLAVFIPGLLYDQPMLYLASTLISGIFLILECIRVLNIPPLGIAIRKSFTAFLDEKDAGPLVLTHIYLLVGCSLPLWMSPYLKSNGSPVPLVVFSGILSVGVGDTVASVFGTLLGRHSWPGTKKTVVGTFSSIVAQVLFCCSMDSLGYIHAPMSKYACAVIISSLLEAFTLQIDNLTLPLFLYMMLI